MIARPGPRPAIAFGLLLAWGALTMFGAGRFPKGEIAETIARGVGWNFVLAAGFLLAAAAVLRWPVGLRRVTPGTLRLLWLPALYLLVLGGLVAIVGLPPGRVVAFVAVNAVVVGLSEELMFRGFLFTGLRARLALWPSIWLVSALFGAVHLLNAVSTGAPLLAAVQAAAAFLNGVHFMALRLRCGSIWPPALVHGLWDTLTLLIVLGALETAGADTGAAPSGAVLALPLLLVLPLFVYGTWLLRGAGRAAAA